MWIHGLSTGQPVDGNSLNFVARQEARNLLETLVEFDGDLRSIWIMHGVFVCQRRRPKHLEVMFVRMQATTHADAGPPWSGQRCGLKRMTGELETAPLLWLVQNGLLQQ